MATDDALWEIAKYGPEAPAELVDAARAAFAGQLDGSDAARWRAELRRKFAARGQRAPERESGPTTEARGGAESPAKLPGATPTSVRAMRIKGDQTYLDECGRTCHTGELFTGEVEEVADNGHTELLGTYCSGIEHGRQQEWWPDGTKRAEGVAITGAAVGEWRYWHANGRPSEVVVFAGSFAPFEPAVDLVDAFGGRARDSADVGPGPVEGRTGGCWDGPSQGWSAGGADSVDPGAVDVGEGRDRVQSVPPQFA
ncbi:hypothetical protein DWB77_00295 [Streptomyces hundungensis]|uniref:Uncharacterized protein n=1 Tax=Streptomyces hundungensis TaxID=1077946 RepID=A0A387HC37_9ACTN|nr:hypothetical protein [Streptomyces hundungensis]AYG78188.1 hypothetical protein DWB77_00295 [Streptomyces hundungensis]